MAIVGAGVLNAWEGLVSRLRAGGEVVPRLVMRAVARLARAAGRDGRYRRLRAGV